MKTAVAFAVLMTVAVIQAKIIDVSLSDQTHQQQGDAGNSVSGSYSFTDDEGTTHTVRYIADDKGYRVTGRSSVAGPKVAQPAPTPAPIPVPAPVPVPAPTPVYYIVRAPTSFHGSAYHSPIIASGNGAQPVYYIANGQPRYYSHFNSYYPGGQRFYFASY